METGQDGVGRRRWRKGVTTAAAGGSRRGMERTPKTSFSWRAERGESGYYGRGVGAECSEVEGIGGGLKLVLHSLLGRSGVVLVS